MLGSFGLPYGSSVLWDGLSNAQGFWGRTGWALLLVIFVATVLGVTYALGKFILSLSMDTSGLRRIVKRLYRIAVNLGVKVKASLDTRRGR